MSSFNPLLLGWARLFAAVAGVSLPGASIHEAQAADEPSTFLDSRVGWVDTCLAIKNDALRSGTPVTLLMFEKDERVLAGRVLTRRLTGKILAKTSSAAKCPARGIAVITAGDGPIDLDRNGAADGYTLCSTGQGIGYIAWVAEAPAKPSGNDLLWAASPFTLRKPVQGLKHCPDLQ